MVAKTVPNAHTIARGLQAQHTPTARSAPTLGRARSGGARAEGNRTMPRQPIRARPGRTTGAHNT
eukprot:15434255-Alexandrium_andersonii.AAC.1